jgi:hypothetical protein
MADADGEAARLERALAIMRQGLPLVRKLIADHRVSACAAVWLFRTLEGRTLEGRPLWAAAAPADPAHLDQEPASAAKLDCGHVAAGELGPERVPTGELDVKHVAKGPGACLRAPPAAGAGPDPPNLPGSTRRPARPRLRAALVFTRILEVRRRSCELRGELMDSDRKSTECLALLDGMSLKATTGKLRLLRRAQINEALEFLRESDRLIRLLDRVQTFFVDVLTPPGAAREPRGPRPPKGLARAQAPVARPCTSPPLLSVAVAVPALAPAAAPALAPAPAPALAPAPDTAWAPAAAAHV